MNYAILDSLTKSSDHSHHLYLPFVIIYAERRRKHIVTYTEPT